MALLSFLGRYRMYFEAIFKPVDKAEYKAEAAEFIGKKLPIQEFLKYQGRFKKILQPENKPILKHLQDHIDSEWSKILKLCGEK